MEKLLFLLLTTSFYAIQTMDIAVEDVLYNDLLNKKIALNLPLSNIFTFFSLNTEMYEQLGWNAIYSELTDNNDTKKEITVKLCNYAFNKNITNLSEITGINEALDIAVKKMFTKLYCNSLNSNHSKLKKLGIIKDQTYFLSDYFENFFYLTEENKYHFLCKNYFFGGLDQFKQNYKKTNEIDLVFTISFVPKITLEDESLIFNDDIFFDETTKFSLLKKAASNPDFLCQAIRKKNLKKCKLLIAHGANVDAHENDGYAPLYLATKEQEINIMRFLLESGANPDILCIDGMDTPLYLACENMYHDYVLLLLQYRTNKYKDEILLMLSKKGYTNIIQLLLFHKANPNFKNKHKNSPLNIAASSGNESIVKLLLEHPEIDVNIIDCMDETPLHNACYRGHTNIVQLLLEHNANPNIKNNNDQTPYDIALKHNYSDVASLLLKYKD